MSHGKRKWRCETGRAGRWEANGRDCADVLELRRERERGRELPGSVDDMQRLRTRLPGWSRSQSRIPCWKRCTRGLALLMLSLPLLSSRLPVRHARRTIGDGITHCTTSNCVALKSARHQRGFCHATYHPYIHRQNVNKQQSNPLRAYAR